MTSNECFVRVQAASVVPSPLQSPFSAQQDVTVVELLSRCSSATQTVSTNNHLKKIVTPPPRQTIDFNSLVSYFRHILAMPVLFNSSDSVVRVWLQRFGSFINEKSSAIGRPPVHAFLALKNLLGVHMRSFAAAIPRSRESVTLYHGGWAQAEVSHMKVSHKPKSTASRRSRVVPLQPRTA